PGFQPGAADEEAPATPTIDLDAASDSGASNADNVTADNTPSLSGTAEAGSTVAIIDGTSNVLATTTAANDGAWSVTLSPLVDGEYTLFARSPDQAGNVSTSSGLTIFIDTADPVVDAGADQTANEGD